MILASLAFAADPPERPKPPAPVPGECAKSIPVVVDTAIPSSLLSAAGKAACSGVLVPSSQLADLLATEVWADELDGRYRVDMASIEVRLSAEQAQSEWWKEQAERPKAEPIALVGVGLIGGIGLTVLSAWAMGQVVP